VPVEGDLEIAAEERADRRRDRQRHADEGEDPGRVLAPEQVAHHGPADHRPRADADGLHEAAGEQHLDRAGEAADDAARDEDHEAHEQHPATPEPVGERAVGELRDRKAGEVDPERRLDHGRRRRQRRRDRGHGGRVHGHCQRAQRHRGGERGRKPALRHPGGEVCLGGVGHASI
jgi:hypothetical protein